MKKFFLTYSSKQRGFGGEVMKKIKGCILIFLCVVILSGMLLYFYPVKEISGYVSTADNMCFRINSDGVIEYYINYSIYHFMESGPDDCPKYRSSHAASRRLNLLEKAEINKYVRRIKKSENKGKSRSGTDGFTEMCLKIDGEKYYSEQYQKRFSKDEYVEYELPDVIDLCTYLWYTKPEECDRYWDNSYNSFPNGYMDRDNYKDVLDFFRNYHNRMVN